MITPLIVRALKNEVVERTPVWFMRQAGRHLPEYRALRQRHSFMELCYTPSLAAEVTLQPVRRYGVDGAILFSDILLVLDAMGAGVRFEPGPIIDRPVTCAADIDKLKPVDPHADLGAVQAAIKLIKAELPPSAAMLGFAGAPFTLLTYLLDHHGPRGLLKSRAFLLDEPALAARLLDKLAIANVAQLAAQIEAGAQAVQLFDTWGGSLTPALWRRFAAPYARKVFEGLRALGHAATPMIYFTRGTAGLLGHLKEAGADAYGVDWTCDLAKARATLGAETPVQGNLDPAVLLSATADLNAEVAAVLKAAGPRGHVFNLGHGVDQDVDPARFQATVEAVRRLSEAQHA